MPMLISTVLCPGNLKLKHNELTYRDLEPILKLWGKYYNKVINQVSSGSQEEGVGLTLLREIKEGFLEMTSSTVLKPSSQGEREDILGIEGSKYMSTSLGKGSLQAAC